MFPKPEDIYSDAAQDGTGCITFLRSPDWGCREFSHYTDGQTGVLQFRAVKPLNLLLTVGLTHHVYQRVRLPEDSVTPGGQVVLHLQVKVKAL